MSGLPVSVYTIGERRDLIGVRISWLVTGWNTRRDGVVTEVNGKNMLIDGNWVWAPSMQDVRIEGYS